MYSIYRITNKLNNKCYIGQSANVEQRWKEHLDNLTYPYKRFAFQNALIKYGVDNFIWEVIENFLTLEEVNNAEECYIYHFNTLVPNGYNLLPGGNNRACHESTKKKISEKLKVVGSFVGKKGSDHPNYGTKLSEERKLKISIQNSGDNCATKKINSTIAREVYLERLNNNTSVENLVIKFGIANSSIRNILSKRSWKDALSDLPKIQFNNTGPAKFTKGQVLSIRNLYDSKTNTITELCKIFNVTYCCITKVVNRETYKYY